MPPEMSIEVTYDVDGFPALDSIIDNRLGLHHTDSGIGAHGRDLVFRFHPDLLPQVEQKLGDLQDENVILGYRRLEEV
jgi:hypothetical protein